MCTWSHWGNSASAIWQYSISKHSLSCEKAFFLNYCTSDSWGMSRSLYDSAEMFRQYKSKCNRKVTFIQQGCFDFTINWNPVQVKTPPPSASSTNVIVWEGAISEDLSLKEWYFQGFGLSKCGFYAWKHNRHLKKNLFLCIVIESSAIVIDHQLQWAVCWFIPAESFLCQNTHRITTRSPTDFKNLI